MTEGFKTIHLELKLAPARLKRLIAEGAPVAVEGDGVARRYWCELEDVREWIRERNRRLATSREHSRPRATSRHHRR